jgi:glycine cleavage system transcriptional repressor
MRGDKTQDGFSEEDPRHGLVLTAVGPDRPGLVKGLAAQIRKWGGNLEDTRMSKLGGEFAVLMLVTGSPDSLARIKAAKMEMELETGLTCSLRSTLAPLSTRDTETHRFVATGMDRPGIVEAVTRVLADRNVNLTSLESRVDNAPLTGTLMFVLEAEVTLPAGIHIDDLENDLAEACEREDLEFTLMRA